MTPVQIFLNLLILGVILFFWARANKRRHDRRQRGEPDFPGDTTPLRVMPTMVCPWCGEKGSVKYRPPSPLDANPSTNKEAFWMVVHHKIENPTSEQFKDDQARRAATVHNANCMSCGESWRHDPLRPLL